MKTFSKVSVAFAALALMVGGCGGNSGGDSDEALTKTQFILRADQICERTDEVQKDGFREYFAKRPNAVASRAANEKVLLAIGLPAIQNEAKELDELPVPDGDEEEIQAIIEGMNEAIEKAEEDPSLLVNLKNDAGPFTKVGKLAGDYGLRACSLPL